MGRHLLATVVLVVDTALLVAAHRGELSPWTVAAFAVAVALIIALRHRSPTAACVVTLVFAALTGGAFALLIWVSYQAGHAIASRSGTVVVAAATLGTAAGQLMTATTQPRLLPNLVSTYVVFVALPFLVGRYLAQHRRLVAALNQRNEQLRWRRDVLAEQERLRERLRIARDMHDSLGHRLSLVSVQAAALEVAPLPAPQRQAVQQLARSTREAMSELYDLVSALRGPDDPAARAPGAEAIAALVEEFRTAGIPATLREVGPARPLPPAAGQAAYRVVQEGLTNAAKHAPGRPVAVNVEWEPDALLLTLANPAPPGAAVSTGHGLAGLGERVRPAGGFLDHRLSDGVFRLVAMLPTVVAPPAADDEDPATVGRLRTVALGVATAALMFGVLPAGMLLGVR